jgi:hypothetical protein
MINTAKQRGFSPKAVLFDSWYSSLDNLKLIREHGWIFLTQLKANRKVDLNRPGYKAVVDVPIEPTGTVVHVEGFGSIRAFRGVTPDGDVGYWVINDLTMNEIRRLELAERSWAVEEYHRALKQCCNVERCQAPLARAQRNHIEMAIRGFVQLAWSSYTTGSAITKPRRRLPERP